MPRWNKESALAELELLVEQVNGLEHSRRNSAEHVRWIARCASFLEQVFGPSSLYFLSFKQLSWRQTGGFFIQAWDVQGAVDQRHHAAYLNDLDTARGLLQAAHDELSATDIDDVFKGKDGAQESSGTFKILSIAEQKLRKAIRQPPTKERDVQDAFENLLIGSDMEYSRESENVQYSSKNYVPDFVIRNLDLAIEIKLSSRAEREKEMISEINDDILAYRQKFRNVLFVVYDLGFIRDVDKFTRHFEENEGVIVRIVKH